MEPIRLEGRFVRLEPLSLDHTEALFEASRDAMIWKYLMVPQPQSVAEMADWIDEALRQQASGAHLPFSVFSKESNGFVGSTRYLDIRLDDRSIEIGWTWYRPESCRTAVNTECKYLLLRNAFEVLGCERVQLKTDALNGRSRKAIERIGGKFEGVLRQFQRYWHGRQRDTAMYSILSSEWPSTRRFLLTALCTDWPSAV
jgi:RimJ/RimL family protein N-acetyltransferase